MGRELDSDLLIPVSYLLRDTSFLQGCFACIALVWGKYCVRILSEGICGSWLSCTVWKPSAQVFQQRISLSSSPSLFAPGGFLIAYLVSIYRVSLRLMSPFTWHGYFIPFSVPASSESLHWHIPALTNSVNDTGLGYAMSEVVMCAIARYHTMIVGLLNLKQLRVYAMHWHHDHAMPPSQKNSIAILCPLECWRCQYHYWQCSVCMCHHDQFDHWLAIK